MASPSRPSPNHPSTIDLIGEDLLQNIVTRLPAASFAFAACVNRSWNLVCDRLLVRPKLASASSFNSSLNVAVEDVVSKVLSSPIRPHFAIASVGPYFDFRLAHQLITAKLGSKVPVITNDPAGVIGRNAFSDEFKEIQWEVTEEDDDPDENLVVSESANRAVMLTVGFVPGLKVEAIPLLKQVEEQCVVMVDKFVMDIREFSTFISGLKSPAAIIIFNTMPCLRIRSLLVIVTASSYIAVKILSTQPSQKNKCLWLLPWYLQSTGTDLRVLDKLSFMLYYQVGCRPLARHTRQHLLERINMILCLGSLQEETDRLRILMLGDRIQFPTFYIGVTKRRKCSIGEEKLGWITSLAFHEVLGDNQEYLFVGDTGIKTGDTFRFYHSDSATALSSISNVSDQLRSFKEASIADGNKREVFGSLIFTCCGRGESFFGQPNVDSSPFLENFPGVTFGGTFCGGEIGRGDLTPYVKESQEQRSVRCCLHVYSAVYLVMSYTPSNGN